MYLFGLLPQSKHFSMWNLSFFIEFILISYIKIDSIRHSKWLWSGHSMKLMWSLTQIDTHPSCFSRYDSIIWYLSKPEGSENPSARFLLCQGQAQSQYLNQWWFWPAAGGVTGLARWNNVINLTYVIFRWNIRSPLHTLMIIIIHTIAISGS